MITFQQQPSWGLNPIRRLSEIPTVHHLSRQQPKRGSAYLLVLASSILVTIFGLASLQAIRVQRRTTEINKDSTQARHLARAAIEVGFYHIDNDSQWRTNWPNGVWDANQPLNGGTYTLEGVDPADNDISDSIYDQIVLTGNGSFGKAQHMTQVTLVPEIKPLESLQTCLHGGDDIYIQANKKITVVGASVSCNDRLDNDGAIDGDAEVDRISSLGTITGNLTIPITDKANPDPNVISEYIAKATTIPFTGNIMNQVLSAGHNPWGSPNANGVYYIHTGNNHLTIKDTRIHGTLIVDTGSRTLTLEDSVFMHPNRSDYPTLLVDGDLVIRCKALELSLSEVTTGVNFNPSGAGYEGQTDSDTLDIYPNEIRGLVHVTNRIWLQESSRVLGTILCNRHIYVEGVIVIIYDSTLYAIPPEGYTYVPGLKVSPGSFKRFVD